MFTSEAATVDSRQAVATRVGSVWQLLPVWPATRIHWSHYRGLLLFQAIMVVHPISAEGNTPARTMQLHLGLVERLETTMDRTTSQRGWLHLRFGCLGALEREKCKVLPRSEHSGTQHAQPHQARGRDMGASQREEPRLSSSASNRVVKCEFGWAKAHWTSIKPNPPM
jgi:hypothetical protein